MSSRTRSKQEMSPLSAETIKASRADTPVPDSTPVLRNRLRKRPTWERTNVAKTSPRPHLPRASRPPILRSPDLNCSRGTLGGFCGIEELERRQTPNPNEKHSVMKNVGKIIGLGLHLQTNSPTDPLAEIDGTESWYMSYPPPTPVISDEGVEYVEVVEVEQQPQPERKREVAIEIHADSFREDEQSSFTSSNSSIYASSLSSLPSYQDVIDNETLILSAQHLAEQYRNLLSRAPTPGPYLLDISLPQPGTSCFVDVSLPRPNTPFLVDLSRQATHSLTPPPLQFKRSQVLKSTTRPKRPLSEKNPPVIPQRQHFNTPKRTLRKVQARHSLHKYVDLSAYPYEQYFKASRLSECETLVSSKENTPISSPVRKDMEAFPQIWHGSGGEVWI
jgi:hypothetical protein